MQHVIEKQRELYVLFGIARSSDFKEALRQGKIKLAESWLQYIIDNKEKYTVQGGTWDGWILDRQRDIELAKSKQLSC
jgi:hypothetical protein